MQLLKIESEFVLIRQSMRLLHVKSPMRSECCSHACSKQLGSFISSESEAHWVQVKTDLGLVLTLGAHAQRELLSLSCVYVCVCSLIPAASHIGITKEGYQRILRNTGIVLKFVDFTKNASFKSYGVICLPRAAPAS